MKIEITKQEAEILHVALIRLIEDTVKASDLIRWTGGEITPSPAYEVKKLHSKIISATED